MTTYVNHVPPTLPQAIMGQLWADTLDELHATAAAIGLAAKSFRAVEKEVALDHYPVPTRDLAERAVAAGAVLMDHLEPSIFIGWRDNDFARVSFGLALREVLGMPLDGRLTSRST